MLRFAALGVLAASAAGAAEPALSAAPSARRSAGAERWEETFTLTFPRAELRLETGGLLWGSERVYRDGRPLRADRDYTLDPGTGLLRFAAAVPAGAVVRVYYTAPFLLSPATAAPMAKRPAGLRDRLRSALSAAPEGPGFAAAVTPGPPSDRLREELQSGLRLIQHADRLTAADQTSSVTYFKADPVDPQTAGAGREEFQSSLDLRPGRASRLRLLNAFSRESLFTEQYEQHERQRLQFEQTLGKSTANLLWERRRSDGRGLANALDALSLTLAHPFGRRTLAEGYFSFEDSLYRGRETESLVSMRQRMGSALSARAGLQFRTSEFSGNTMETGLTLVAQPGRGSDLTLALRQADSERYGRYQRLSADLNAAVSRRLQLVGELSRRTTEQYGSIDTLGLGIAARPTGYSVLEAAFSESTGEALGLEASRTVRLALDPSAALKFQLGYDQTESSREGRSQNALWILTVGGERYVRVEGYAAAHRPSAAGPYNDALYRLELRPLQPLSLSAHLRRVLLNEDERAVAGVGAGLRVLRVLEVAAAYRQPAVEGRLVPDVSGQDLRISFVPLPRLRLYGHYSLRPEDERGALLEQVHRSVGLETTFGGLSLTGSFTRMEGGFSTDPGRRVDVLAALSLGSGTRFYGGIRTQDPLILEQQRSRVYRLGVSRTAGAAFLMLEGQFGWLVDGTGSRAWSPEDALAQARVGLRF